MNTAMTASTLAEKIKSRTPGALEKPKKPLDAKPDCQRCRGFGWVQSKQYDMHWFMCPCVLELENEVRENRNRFDPSVIGLRESDLSLSWQAVRPGISDGIEAVKAIKPFYERGFGMVYLWGSWGQAKTLVGKILTATAHRDHKKAAYANVSAVLDNIRLAFDEPEHKTTELLKRIDWWINRDVLFLDEMDKSNDTPWAQERLFQLLDQRYMKAVREEALTVIASNKSDESLDGYLKSRLHDRRVGKIVCLNGKDGRQVMPDGYKF